MKTFMKNLKKQDGFTLVELMVVVAIIGLLSAVAIPNFKKYQAKAKMSEAKLQLSAIYTAEAAFFSDYNIYSTCLPYMGFDPNPEILSRYYAVGFTGGTAATDPGAYTAATNSGLNTTGCPAANAVSAATAPVAGVSTLGPTTWFPAGKGVGSVVAATAGYVTNTAIGSQTNTIAMTYVAGAGGVIDGATASMAAGTNSIVTINEQKVVAIRSNGY